MNSFNKTWNKSYSESDLMSSFSETFSPMRSPIIIRRTVCMEEVVPSFIPLESAYYNKIGSPHRRKNYQHYKANMNLNNKRQVPEEIEFQIANLNLTNNQFNQSFSSFSYCSPKPKDLTFENSDFNENIKPSNPNLTANISETQPMEVDSFKDSKNNSKITEVINNDCDTEDDKNIVENECISSPVIKQENILRLRNLRVQLIDNNTSCDQSNKTDKKLIGTTYKIFLTILAVLFLWVGFNSFTNTFDLDSKEFRVENLRKDLTKVYKQNDAVNAILYNLENRGRWRENKKLIAFVGSSGVGKTFVINILKANFPKKCVHEINGEFLSVDKAIHMDIANFNSNSLNLVIIDDIKDEAVNSLLHFMDSFDVHKHILVIPVFSSVVVDDYLEKTINYKKAELIKNEFQNHNLDYDIAIFNQFSESDVENWITGQLLSRQIPSGYHEKIIKNLLEDYDIKRNGLKGLHSRIVLEVKNFV